MCHTSRSAAVIEPPDCSRRQDSKTQTRSATASAGPVIRSSVTGVSVAEADRYAPIPSLASAGHSKWPLALASTLITADDPVMGSSANRGWRGSYSARLGSR